MRHYVLFAAIGLAAAMPASTPAFAKPAPEVNVEADGLAARGYDVTAYFTQGRPVRGNAAHQLQYKGVTWRFASAEAQAYVSFHFYAMAIEAAARVDIGEQHTGILLATTAMGAIETLQGSEYGLHTRVLCCDALAKAGSPQAEEMRRRAAAYVRSLLNTIRDPELRVLFVQRRLVLDLWATSPEAPPPRPLSIDDRMDPPDREGSPLSS